MQLFLKIVNGIAAILSLAVMALAAYLPPELGRGGTDGAKAWLDHRRHCRFLRVHRGNQVFQVFNACSAVRVRFLLCQLLGQFPLGRRLNAPLACAKRGYASGAIPAFPRGAGVSRSGGEAAAASCGSTSSVLEAARAMAASVCVRMQEPVVVQYLSKISRHVITCAFSNHT